MGLLRKKTSKPQLSKDSRVQAPPPQLPPLPGHIRRAQDASPPGLSPQSQASSNMRRRSRSLWATSDEAKAATAGRPLANDMPSPGDLASQPWRSASTWAALHSPARPPSILSTLVNPCSPNTPAPGWRGKGGGGFFTSAAMDNEIAKRTPGSAGSGTPGQTPMSPSRRTRAVVTPSHAVPAARRLDFGGSSPDPSSGAFAASSPIPITPRSLRRRSASLSELTPNAVVTGSSPATPGVLLTPTSTNLLPSLTSRTPSPIARDSLASVSSGSSKPSPTRALPQPPTESDGEPDSFHSAAEDDENQTEIIDFSRPTPKELAAAAKNTPLRRDAELPKRSSSTTRSHSTTTTSVSGSSVPASPRQQHFALANASPSQHYAALPAATVPSPGQQCVPLPDQGRVPPHAALAAPSSFTPSPPAAGAFIQPRQVSAGSTLSGSSHSHGHSQQAPSRTASSSSQRVPSRSGSSQGHSEGALPHTPDGIAHAINVWRRRSFRRDGSPATGVAAPAPGPRRASMNKDKPDVLPPNPDVFAPTGAWEAQGAYNPYEESAFTDEPDFTPPLRLPVVPGAQPQPQNLPQRLPQRPSPPTSSAPRMNIMQMQARRPSAGGVRTVPPAGRRPQGPQQWI